MQSDFMAHLNAADPRIFQIASQTSHEDKQSLLDIQSIIRNAATGYTYLEVGSHLGGTLFPHLVDEKCRDVVSIDPRPLSQPDERGRFFDYEENSTARMISNLERLVPRGMIKKLRCYDIDASGLADIGDPFRARLALIDGEHTNKAAFRDFLNIMPFMEDDCIVAFHDSQLVFDAISNVEAFLQYIGKVYKGFYLPDCVYAVGLGNFARFVEHALKRGSLDADGYIARSRIALYHSISANLGTAHQLKSA